MKTLGNSGKLNQYYSISILLLIYVLRRVVSTLENRGKINSNELNPNIHKKIVEYF